MPQALALAAPAMFAAGGSVALFSAAGTLTVAGIGVSVASTLAISYAANKLFAPDAPEAARPENAKINTKQVAGPRVGHFGKVLVGGNVVFHRAKNGFSYRVIVHGHGEITEVLKVYLNDVEVSLNGAGEVTNGKYNVKRSRVKIKERLGDVPSPYYSLVEADFASWTSAHRLDGQWTSLIICESVPAEKFRKVYPNGEPELTVLAKTTKCYDPRTDQTKFTENMALAIAHYVASPDGFNRPDAFDPADIAAQADICDLSVDLAEGGSEKMYRVSGSYLLNEQPANVLGRMLSACAGRVRLKPTGKVALKVGYWVEPSFTLAFDQVLEVQKITSGPDLLDRYNELPGRYSSRELGYVEVDAEPWRDNLRAIEDGEVLTGQAKTLVMCPSHRQARQVLKIHTERDNPRQEVTMLCKPKALPAIYEDTIRLDVPQLSLVGDYEVGGHVLTFDRGLLRSVTLTLRLVDSAAFSLSEEEQGDQQPLPSPFVSDGVPLPESFTAAAAGVRSAQNVFVAGIGAAWAPPPSDALAPLLKVSEAGEDDWQAVSVDAEATTAAIQGLTDGDTYDLSLAFVTPSGVVGDAVVVSGVTARAVTGAPSAPSSLSVTGNGLGVATVEFVTSGDEGLWKTEIYRDGALIDVTYAGPGSAVSYDDNCGTGTFSWTARSVNVSNIASTTDAGPVSATIA